MTRNRITVRGEGIELRGYIDAESGNEIERLFADDLDERAVIMVSPAEDDYNPFVSELPEGISEPDFPPDLNASREIIQSTAMHSTGVVDFFEQMAVLHYNQALVIRGERGRAERAEASGGNA